MVHRINLSCLPVCLSLSLLLGLDVSSSLAADYMTSATALYKKGQYKEAQRYLEAELRTNPRNAGAHYLLGNVLFCTKSPSQAAREYQCAVELDPQGPSGLYSKQALARIEDDSKNAASRACPDPKAGDKTDVALKQAVSSASRQTAEASKALEAECDSKLAEIDRVLDDKVKVLQEEMKGRIAENGTYHLLVGGRYGAVYDPEPMNKPIREEYGVRIQALQDQASLRRENVKDAYKKRIVIMEETGLNADKGLINADQGRDIKLRANGSDLHVHNYESNDQASGHVVPLIAEPGKLSRAAKKVAPSRIIPNSASMGAGK